MTLDTGSLAMPMLRFPQFHGAPAWERMRLSELVQRSPEYGVNAAAVPYSESLPTYVRITDINDDGRLGSEPRVSVDIDSTEANYLEDGDIVLARTGASVGKSYRYRPHDGRLVYAGFLVRVRPDPASLLPGYLAAYLSSDAYWVWVRLTSARSGQPGINGREYASMPIPVPRGRLGLAEQRRVAECIESLDDLIAATGRKLDLLERHKTGLMQTLFPRPGENEPHLRLPGFRQSPLWRSRSAGSLFAQRSERGQPGLPLYSVTIAEGMVERSTIERNFYDIKAAADNQLVRQGDVAYNTMRMWQGACGVAPADCMVSPAYVVLAPKDDVHSAFFGYYFKTGPLLERLAAYSRGLTKDRLRLYYEDFASIPIVAPEWKEQVMIADSLSALDALVSASRSRLIALKAHRKGLIQQLIPHFPRDS